MAERAGLRPRATGDELCATGQNAPADASGSLPAARGPLPVPGSQPVAARRPSRTAVAAGELWLAAHLPAPAPEPLLERLAAAAGKITPRVSLEPPDGVLLEVRGSLALFGGVEAVCEKLRTAGHRVGVPVRLALAPTPLAALAGARAPRRRGSADFRVMHRAELVGALAPLPLAVLRLPEEVIERLAKTGVTEIGQALRLPRAGLARRFGPETLAALDRLIGARAEPRRNVSRRERYRARRDPSYELTSQQAISAFLAPMLAELEIFLRGRQGGITALECRLHHREGAATRCRLRFAQPAFAAAAIGYLLGEHLATTVLAAPVTTCELVSSRLVSRQSASAALWQPGEHGGSLANEAPVLIERLRARLGEESVYGLCLVPEHRPEKAWQRVAALRGPSLAANASGPQPVARCPLPATTRRPLWLLSTPLLLPAPGAWPH
ncbi:MAG TPA: DNA polymerase Y family protein, partial [Steroidobacteraceae bacterium]|nr:DNA polymerase Y family protein [Steroidobacteraceae bacterium]